MSHFEIGYDDSNNEHNSNIFKPHTFYSFVPNNWAGWRLRCDWNFHDGWRIPSNMGKKSKQNSSSPQIVLMHILIFTIVGLITMESFPLLLIFLILLNTIGLINGITNLMMTSRCILLMAMQCQRIKDGHGATLTILE